VKIIIVLIIVQLAQEVEIAAKDCFKTIFEDQKIVRLPN
jgi:hypothetical protein